MAKDIKGPTKVCPVCNKEYPEEDNYCGTDGSRLEAGPASSLSSEAGAARDADAR